MTLTTWIDYEISNGGVVDFGGMANWDFAFIFEIKFGEISHIIVVCGPIFSLLVNGSLYFILLRRVHNAIEEEIKVLGLFIELLWY